LNMLKTTNFSWHSNGKIAQPAAAAEVSTK